MKLLLPVLVALCSLTACTDFHRQAYRPAPLHRATVPEKPEAPAPAAPSVTAPAAAQPAADLGLTPALPIQ